MPAPISAITPISPDIIRPAGESAAGGGFKDAFNSAVQTVNAYNQEASDSIQRFLSGDGEELHRTVMATQRAELSLDLFLQVRNKVVSAYQEIMRMQM